MVVSSLTSLAVVLSSASLFAPSTDWAAVIMEANLPRDVEFLYEGGYTFVKTDERITYSCKGVYHRSGVVRMHRHALSTGDRVHLSFRMGRERSATGVHSVFLERNTNPSALQIDPWFTLFWPVPHLQAWGKPVTDFLTLEREEIVDGHACHVFSLPLADDNRDAEYLGYRFWVDMQRGANMLRWESYMFGAVSQRLYDVKLQEFSDKRGRQFWLPVKAKREGFSGGEKLTSSEYYLLAHSVRLNTGLKAEQVELQPLPTQLVPPKNRVTGPRVSPEEAAPGLAHMDRQSAEQIVEYAKQQEDELLKKSRQVTRQRTDWVSWIAMALAAVGLAAVGAAYWLRRGR